MVAQSEPTLGAASCKITNVRNSLESNKGTVIIYESYWMYSSSSLWAVLPTLQVACLVTACFWLNFAFVFKPSLVQNCSRINVHNVLTAPVLPSGCELWTPRKKDNKWLTSVYMQFFRRTAVYTLLLTAKGMKRFWKNLKWNHLTRN
jgi:hypothetical protein